MAIYLLHFSDKLAHSQHYIGFCVDNDPSDRLTTHLQGTRGAKIVKAAIRAGLGVELALIIPDADRNFERKLKNRGGAGRWCPICAVNSRPVPRFDPNVAPKLFGVGLGRFRIAYPANGFVVGDQLEAA